MAVIVQVTEDSVQEEVEVNTSDSRIVETLAGAAGPSGITVVHHGTNGATARPTGAVIAYWLGTATPANAQPYDLWLKENI